MDLLLRGTTTRSKWLWPTGALFCAINALVPAASTVLMGKLFDNISSFISGGLSQADFRSETFKYCLGLFCLAAASLVTESIAGSIWRYEGFSCGHNLRLKIFKSYCDGDMSWMDSNHNSAGVSAQAFEDVKRVEMALGIGIGSGIETIITIVSCYATALYYSWAVTLVCMAGFPFIVAIIGVTSPMIATKMAVRKDLEDHCSDKLHFVFSAIDTVKIFLKEKHEQMRSNRFFGSIYKAELQGWHINTIQASLVRFLSLAMFVQGFYFGHYMVTKHGLSSGGVMAAFWACISGTEEIQRISTVLMTFSEGVVSASRLAKVTDHNIEEEVFKKTIGLVPPASAVPMDIKFSGVVFSYPTRPALVLRGLDLELEAGKIHYIVGPSGCGKSSLAAVIFKQYELQAGSVYVGGNPIETAAPGWIHENITLVEQSAGLFDLSICDNLKLGSKHPDSITDNLIQSALHEFNADFVYSLPQGVHTSGSHPLSGGQRQRLQLAKAWIRNSPIMIFDESTSAMDKRLEAEAMAAIREYRRGKTTIIITHNMGNVPEGEPVYLIEDGLARKEWNWKQNHQDTVPLSPVTSGDTVYSDFKGETYSEVVSVEREFPEKNHYLRAFVHSMPNKWLLVLGFLGVACQAILTPVFSYAFSHLLTGIMPNQGVNVTFWALIILLIAFLEALMGYTAMLLQVAASKWCLKVRDTLLDKLVTYGCFTPTDCTYYRKLLLGDIDMCKNIITRVWSGLANLIILGTVGLTWSIVTGWKLSLVGLCLVPLVAVSTWACNHVNQVWFGHVEASTLKVRRTLEQVVAGMRSVKSQHMEHYFRDEYRAREKILFETAIRAGIYTSICDGVLLTFTPLAQGIVLWFGTHLISTGEYTVNRTMMVLSLLIFSLVSLDGLATAIQQCGNAFEALPRIMRALEENTLRAQLDCVGYEAPVDGLNWGKIVFRSISMQNTLLSNLSYSVEPGVTAVIGTTGSGKSTLMRALLKLQTPEKGAVFIDGVDIERMSCETLRSHIAVVPQMPVHFFSGTIRENLTYGREASFQKVRHVCSQVNLHEFISALEDGYDTRIKDGLLSGGQMQRLAVARALLIDAPIMILDEPTSALDAENSILVQQILRDCANKGCTVLVVTHQVEMMQQADHVLDISKY